MHDEERRLQKAAFRYRVIAEAVECSKGRVSQAVKRAASTAYIDDGQEVRVTERTIWRWLSAYHEGGVLKLQPKARQDRRQLRAFSPAVLEQAAKLRKENHDRPTKTIIDILERKGVVSKGQIARSTLDRHFELMGLSRYALHRLGEKTYKKILTVKPLELVIADFHHGPYVRVEDDRIKKALLLAFIDHFSRYVMEARYFLHEDFTALRFGFRRLLLIFGLFPRLYIDNGPCFQSARFHAACSHSSMGIEIVHSKPYVSEGRGACERFNRTLKDQFESEVRARDELLTLDELNAYFEAWLSERYHSDIHSEIHQTPTERFTQALPAPRPAPQLDLIDELLRIRYPRKVHKKWSTVSVDGRRYVVEPALRGRLVHALYDPFDIEYVLIEYDGRIVQRAFEHKPGHPTAARPESSSSEKTDAEKTDYLALLRSDYEHRLRCELKALQLRPTSTQKELSLLELVCGIERCRGSSLSEREHAEVSALFRKLRPIEPKNAKKTLTALHRKLGTALHLRVYLDAFQTALVHYRTEGGKS